MSSDRFTLLATKKLTGEINPAEQSELDTLLLSDELAARFELLQKFWKPRQQQPEPNVELALQKTLLAIQEEEPVEKQKHRSKLTWFYRAAAAAAVIFAAWMLLPFGKGENTPKSIIASETFIKKDGELEKQNQKATRSLITLADGSQVWLNANSRLIYPESFDADTREVKLIGEAFFNVAKNREKPFIIHLQSGTIKVLGTSFNVKAYENAKTVETSVVTGKVAFVPKTEKGVQQDTVFLTPNLKIVYRPQSGNMDSFKAVTTDDMAWTEGKMIFRSMPMDEIAETLERNFGKKVLFNNEEVAQYIFSGSFENNSLEDVLYYLSRTKPFTYRITDSQIIISAVSE